MVVDAEDGVVVAVEGPSIPIARGALPAGRWDRVFIATERVETLVGADVLDSIDGLTPDVERAHREPIESHIEPIAFGFDALPGTERSVELELIILDRPSRPGYFRIFVKDARDWVPGSASAP